MKTFIFIYPNYTINFIKKASLIKKERLRNEERWRH